MNRFGKHLLYACVQSCLMFVLLFLFSCSPESASTEEIQKFLSVNPAITETIFYLEAEEQLLGRSDYCTTPPEARALPSFGTALTPNYEAIARAQPKSIFTDTSSGTPLESLEQLAPVVRLPWLSIEEMQGSVEKLGDILGKSEEASKLSSQLKTTFKPTAKATSPSLLILMEGSDIQKGQLWFMKHGSVHGAAIEAAGFHNGAPNIASGPTSMYLEQLIQQDPQVIIFLAAKTIDSNAKEQLIRSLDIIPSLQAVQNKRVGVIGGRGLY